MVIDNFIKLTKYSTRKKKNLKFKILCIANFYKYKGHYLLLKSLSLIKDIPWELHLLGQSRDLSINQIKKISRELNIEKRVKYLKKIKKEYSYPYYSLGVLFSETESFPNAILEYFSLKLPVLAFNVGDISRLINIKNGSLLNKRNPNHVAMKINELYLDKNLDNKSKFSFSSIKKFSNTQKTLEKYNQFIEKLCVE
jgi:glycosyltransferase involved in cell wall biosynthesis